MSLGKQTFVGFLALIFSSLGSPLRAETAAVFASVGCVGGTDWCDTDIGMAAAEVSAAEVESSTAACFDAWAEKVRLDAHIDAEQSRDLKGRDTQAQKQFRRRYGDNIPRLVSPELLQSRFLLFDVPDVPCIRVAATVDHGCDEDSTSYSWAYPELLSNGDAAVMELRERLKSGVPTGGRMLVEALESRPGEQHIALCNVREINGVLGPPQNCTTVAIVTPYQTILRSQTGGITFCETDAKIRIGGTIDFEFVVHTKNSPEKLVESLRTLLSKELEFATTEYIVRSDDGNISSVNFRSTSALRESKILQSGWRESVDFDLNLYVHDDRLEVHASTKPLICRQASGSQVEYHGPDDSQRQRYATVIDGKIKEYVIKACSSYKQDDAKVIYCN